MRELAQLFKEAREAKGITQKELSIASDVMQCTISRFESGKQDITMDTAKKLASAINDKSLMTKIKKAILESFKRPKQNGKRNKTN